ncbi:MAG: response regulator transcription factor [Gammaproteobacteria bacterium]|jgi:DNA-binding response OmpR family regulator
MRILIIEDNTDLAANIYDFLEAKDHTLDAAADGITGLHLAVVNDYDVIVLDIMLPGIDGLTVCQKLREEAGKKTPVLMLTARDTLEDKVTGFHKGADDYLVKPFALQELEVRLMALQRRGSSAKTDKLTVGDLSFDAHTLSVERQKKAITLTPTGLKILELLMRKSPQVVSRREIEYTLWGDEPPSSDALRSHMHSLRVAIDHPFDKALVHTVHGIGFRLEDTP